MPEMRGVRRIIRRAPRQFLGYRWPKGGQSALCIEEQIAIKLAYQLVG
jgi:hypothetical protein